MKTFTVTFHHTQNYGATLQAYALQHYLETLGAENRIMEYPEPLQAKRPAGPKQLAADAVRKLLGFLRRKQLRRAKASFRQFHTEHMKFSRPYRDAEDLKQNPPDAEVLITGSDQVWNLRTNPGMIPARFLDFGPASARRFSYAASVGRLDYSDAQKEQVREYLGKFRGVSLRERPAARYLSAFTGIECRTVLDPVFLLSRSEWNSIAAERQGIEGPYILCYFVQGNDRIREVLKKLRRETGYPVVAINCGPLVRVHAERQLFDVTPQEFLGLYEKASVVVTTSFHGTAFALVYGKPVYAFVKGKWDSRISDLLDRVGLSAYAIHPESRIPELPEDLTASQTQLAQSIQESKAYLQEMLAE